MFWLFIATFAYLLIALQSTLDKFLLSSRRVGHPATYTFYSGLLSLTAILLLPFGFHLIAPAVAAWEILAGAVFSYGVFFLFWAIRDHEATQVVPVVGAVTAVATYVFSFLLLGERLDRPELWGVTLLVLGGLFISLDFSPQRLRRIFLGFESSLFSGLLLALAYTWFKKFFESDNFVNVYIWTRLGLMLGAASLLLYPAWRKIIWSSLLKFKKPAGQDAHTGSIFVLNKTVGGVGSFLLNYAISLGSVTIVNALISLEYVFIFFLVWGFSFWVAKIFDERRDWVTMAQKLTAVVIITVGMFLVAR
ncbi:MAG: EamA family transporter [Candidatus Pacebacteria bacterium]|nr:EamA family transporter [Candidatus Paceibacterota bacterium]